MTDSSSGGPAPAPPVPPIPPIPPTESPGWQPSPAPPAPPIPPQEYSRRNGVGFGVILIVLGMIFLAGLFIPGLAWWSLWPLLIVVGGFVQMFTPGHRERWGVYRISDGIGTILLGAVLLGCTTGFISWSMWWVLLTLWPVLIIAAGISIIGRGIGQTWLRAVAPIVIWVAVLYAASVSLTGQGGLQPTAPFVIGQPGQAFSFSEPVNGATTARLDLEGGAGDINMRSGTQLVSADGTSQFGKPSFSVTRSGEAADVRIGLGNGQPVVVWPGTVGGRLNVALADGVLWDATISTGASNLDADLANVRVSNLTLKSGAASATVRLGAVPEGVSRSNAVIKSGVSSITVLLPRDAEARVDTHNGLSTTSVDDRFVSRGAGVWQTAGYSSASKTWNVSVESGVSTVSIRTY